MLNVRMTLGSAVVSSVSLSSPKNPPSNMMRIMVSLAFKDMGCPPFSYVESHLSHINALYRFSGISTRNLFQVNKMAQLLLVKVGI